MGARIKVATTAAEIDSVFRVRHQVYVEEEGYMEETPDQRLFDRFDAFPTTSNVIAVVDGRVVGSMRITEDSTAATSSDTFFDFRPYLPSDAGKVGAASQLCMVREYRKVHGITFALMGMTYYLAMAQGLTHLKAVANPDQERLFQKTGWVAVAPVFFHQQHQLRCLPMILDLRELNDRFLAFIKRQNMEHWMRSFERQFHSAGEEIIHAGDEGHEAFIVVEGKVAATAVAMNKQTAPIILQELGPGELFGELALLAARPRTANVVALTDTSLMVLERSAFEEQLARDPDVAIQLLRALSTRFADSISRGRSSDGGSPLAASDPSHGTSEHVSAPLHTNTHSESTP